MKTVISISGNSKFEIVSIGFSVLHSILLVRLIDREKDARLDAAVNLLLVLLAFSYCKERYIAGFRVLHSI